MQRAAPFVFRVRHRRSGYGFDFVRGFFSARPDRARPYFERGFYAFVRSAFRHFAFFGNARRFFDPRSGAKIIRTSFRITRRTDAHRSGDAFAFRNLYARRRHRDAARFASCNRVHLCGHRLHRAFACPAVFRAPCGSGDERDLRTYKTPRAFFRTRSVRAHRVTGTDVVSELCKIQLTGVQPFFLQYALF